MAAGETAKTNNMKNQTQFRQGDVLIERVDTIDTTQRMPRENGRVILAHGEVTGHAHAISAPDVDQYVGAVDATHLEVKTAVAMLQHEEHHTIEIPAGNYRVTRQREYTPEEIRNVAD